MNTLLGITKAKKEIKKELGITEAMKPFRWWTNTKRRMKRKARLRIGCRTADSEWSAEAGGCAVVWRGWWWRGWQSKCYCGDLATMGNLPPRFLATEFFDF